MERIILQSDDIRRAVTRMTHEIVEANRGENRLIILGIPTRGVQLAKLIADQLETIEPGISSYGALDVTMYRDDLAQNPLRQPAPTNIPEAIDDKTVVLVDDVLFSGRTIRAALDAIHDIGRPKEIKLAVLIDRGHRELPIRADFVGKNVPTSKSERVTVSLAEVDGINQVSIS